MCPVEFDLCGIFVLRTIRTYCTRVRVCMYVCVCLLARSLSQVRTHGAPFDVFLFIPLIPRTESATRASVHANNATFSLSIIADPTGETGVREHTAFSSNVRRRDRFCPCWFPMIER